MNLSCSIESIISGREIVRNEIASALEDALAGKLAQMSDINIEDVQFGQKIRDAIENKQTAKLDFEAEQYNLDKQLSQLLQVFLLLPQQLKVLLM